MDISLNKELLPYIDPLRANEYVTRERSLLAVGGRATLVLSGAVLLDAHKRYPFALHTEIARPNAGIASLSAANQALQATLAASSSERPPGGAV